MVCMYEHPFLKLQSIISQLWKIKIASVSLFIIYSINAVSLIWIEYIRELALLLS